MTRRMMYFGTRDKMMWVPCPAVDRPASNVGWSESMLYLNGGNYTRRSKGSHRVVEMSWNMISREDAGKIEALAGGAYGDGPYYWIDPMAAEHNVLPEAWAFPGSATYRGGATTQATPANTLDYPSVSVLFTEPNTLKPLWVPVPPGHTAHIGVHGTGVSGITLTPDGGVGSLVPMLPVTSTQRTNRTVEGGANGTGFTLSQPTTGTPHYAGIIVQVLPTGRTVEPGGWLNGLGTSGSEFSGFPERTDYSSVFDKVGVTAVLAEVGSWL